MIESIDKLREYIPTIISGDNFSKYQQSINDARSWVISVLLGLPLMDHIEALGESDILYLKTEKLIAYKAYLFAIPKIDLVETANGFAVVGDAKLLPASRDRVAALVAAMQRSTDQATVELLDHLEDHSELDPAWRNAPAYTVMEDSLIPTLREFRRYGSFEGGPLDFIAARPTIQMIIVRDIEPHISHELTREIILQQQNDTLSDKNNVILGNLKYALAAFYAGDKEMGNILLWRTRLLLEAKPDNFPAFRDSELYKEITEAAARKKDNTSSIYVL